MKATGRWLTAGGSAALLVLLVAPVLAIYLNLTPHLVWEGLRTPVAVQALVLSLVSTGMALVLLLLLGTPLAYWLGVREFHGKRWIETLVELPVAIPPAVTGFGLMLAFGRFGLIGQFLARYGLTLPFTLAAVVIAELVVGAPHYIRAAQQAFAGVDPRLPLMARSLGATPLAAFWRVTLPLARRGLLTGAALAWTRALGEFGATMIFAGNMPGRTQTMPLAIYTALESDLSAALALSAVLATVGFAILVAAKTLATRGGGS